MKRRAFLTNLGIAGPAMALGGSAGHTSGKKEIPTYSYGVPNSLEGIISKEGFVVLRVLVKTVSGSMPVEISVNVKVRKAKINRAKTYFSPLPSSQTLPKKVTVNQDKGDITVLWIEKPSPEMVVSLMVGTQTFGCTLAELVSQQELSWSGGGIVASVNYLLDREIGQVTPAELGIQTGVAEKFRIAIMADTQGGKPDLPGTAPTRMKIHNAFIEDSVAIVNGLETQPVCTLNCRRCGR